MKALKLSAINVELLKRHKIRRVNVEDYAEQKISDEYPSFKPLAKEEWWREWGHGAVVRKIDKTLFISFCHRTISENLRSKVWIQVGTDYYDTAKVIQKLAAAGFQIENDLNTNEGEQYE